MGTEIVKSLKGKRSLGAVNHADFSELLVFLLIFKMLSQNTKRNLVFKLQLDKTYLFLFFRGSEVKEAMASSHCKGVEHIIQKNS